MDISRSADSHSDVLFSGLYGSSESGGVLCLIGRRSSPTPASSAACAEQGADADCGSRGAQFPTPPKLRQCVYLCAPSDPAAIGQTSADTYRLFH